MLLRDFIRDGVSSLESLYPRPEARNIMLMLCEGMLGVKPYVYITDPGTEIDPSMEGALVSALGRLRAAEPVQYVLGYAEFCGHRFRVTPDVLIPRPETELLVQEAIALAGDGRARILDLCTGSGCIAWSLAAALPEAEVEGVDISEEALAVARGQGITDNAPAFIRADALGRPELQMPGPEKEFDLIVSNPPYLMERQKTQMRRNVLDYEPAIALFVPDDDPLKFYRAIDAWAKRLLVPGGHAVVEINDLLAGEVMALAGADGFADVAPIYDLGGAVRHVRFAKRL